MPYAKRYKRSYRRRSSRNTLYKPRNYGVSLWRYKAATGNADRYYTILHRNFTTASGVGAAINLSLPFSGVSACTNWASLAGVFSEFRVEGVTVKFTPSLPNSTTATFTPVYMYFDADGITGTTVAQALEYPSVVSFDLNKPFTKTFTLLNSIFSRASFYSTATPTQQTEGVGFVAEGLSVSTTYGTIQISYMVVFRGGN